MPANSSATPAALYRNRSPYGWWIAAYVERLEWKGEARHNLRRRCLAWVNTIILRASTRERAYAKALRLARSGRGTGWNLTDTKTGRRGRWVVEGLMELVPVHEELEDGAEILWRELDGVTVGRIRGMVRTKKQLPVFDDTAPAG